ncbi:MAG: ABC transporter ATP-binding protein, partial [Alkalimonas sp.]|nr:ABC transporter ATP-binding protein [Alkalimonas sp.]
TNHLDLDMREAIVMALQDFEGAIVVVSHDRHLLTSTTDEFYLVADGKVAPFAGDLQDYYQWLQQDSRKQSSQAESTTIKSDSASQRKDQKRLEAELRNLLRPLKKKLEQAETQQEQLTARLTELEQLLAEPELYEATRKAELTERLAEQASASKTLAQVEEDWFLLQDELEQTEQSFWQQHG